MIDGSGEAVFKEYDETVVNAFVYNHYMYVATETKVYKIDMKLGTEEIIFDIADDADNGDYIAEFVIKQQKIKIDTNVYDSTDAEKTIYVELDECGNISADIVQGDDNEEILVGEEITLKVETVFENTDAVEVLSLNPDVVSVDEAGKLSVNGAGTAVLVVALNGSMEILEVAVTAPLPEFAYGDVNRDGSVDSKDAVIYKKYIAGFTGLTIDLEAGDVNGDGTVDSKDVVKVLQYMAGFDVVLGEE